MRCLACYNSLDTEHNTVHPKCSKRVFGSATPPTLPYTAKQIEEQRDKMLIVERNSDIESPNTLQFCNHDGHFIITSDTAAGAYAELEAVTMLLAEQAKIAVAPHTLIRGEDGSLHHITRRVELGKRGRIMPKFNLGNRGATSYEEVAQQIKTNSYIPKLDVINLYERLLFGYIVGLYNMDLASFEIITSESGESTLAPISRVCPKGIIESSESDDMALSINGKHCDIYASDFEHAMRASGLEQKIIDNIFAKFERSLDQWCEIIDSSTLTAEVKERYKFQIIIRYDML